VYTTFCIGFTLLPLFPNTFPLPLMPVLPLSRNCSALLFPSFIEEKREKIKQKTWFSLFAIKAVMNLKKGHKLLHNSL
jgi:hypothetical protein